MTRKGYKQRPYDVGAAIMRAANCRALRDRAGLNLEALARLGGVTERSARRWEDEEGAGNCPDDVLDILDSLVCRQTEIVDDAASLASYMLRALDHGGPEKSESESESRPRIADFRSVSEASPTALCTASGGPSALNHGVEAGLVQTAPEARKSASLEVDFDAMGGGGGGEGDLDSRFVRLDADSMPWATLLYYPSQRCYAECNPNDSGWYGVANANARAIAQELERLGFGIEWRYATPELVDGFPFDYV